ncbi:MAG: hypothetical protein D6733_01180 [Methanobacteriota archaeon]|nr:MAG: hypothetical protein D6733_01180 [Euryarchaeota archaeon]
MKTKDEILKALSKELPTLKQRFNVKKIGLFGSYARGEQKNQSDIDLLADFDPAIDYFTLFELEEHLSKILGAKVEIVTPGALKETIKPYIMRDLVYA